MKRVKGYGKGYHRVKITNLTPGIYLIRLSDKEGIIVGKAIVVR